MNTRNRTDKTPLRILITGPAEKANEGFSAWAAELDGVSVAGTATGILDALELADTLRPDAVLLDFEVTGYPLLHVVKLLTDTARPPAIIVLAQQANPVVRRHCAEMGVDYVLEKNSDPAEISRVLQLLHDQKKNAGHGETSPASSSGITEYTPLKAIAC